MDERGASMGGFDAARDDVAAHLAGENHSSGNKTSIF
jgi:hypothetical protein